MNPEAVKVSVFGIFEFTETGSGQHLSDEHSQLTAVKVVMEPVVSILKLGG